MEWGSQAQIERVKRSREELAKQWLLRMVERMPLREVENLPINWIVREAPLLITDILDELADPAAGPDLERAAEGMSRAGQLGRLRRSDVASGELPRDLAALQGLLIAALRREIPEREAGAFARSVEQLAQVFGGIQGSVTESVVRDRSGHAVDDELTGLPTGVHLHEWMKILVAGYHRYGHPFSVLSLDIDGLNRINDAYGREVGDRSLAMIGGILKNHLRAADKAFRVSDDDFCVVAPNHSAEEARPLALRVRELAQGSTLPAGPTVAMSIGLASCPRHGESAESLLKAAEEAMYTAKATGEGVAVAPDPSAADATSLTVQDR